MKRLDEFLTSRWGLAAMIAVAVLLCIGFPLWFAWRCAQVAGCAAP